MNLYAAFRPLLFRIPPERAHWAGKASLKFIQSNPVTRSLVQKFYNYHHPSLEIKRFGLPFPNPVGVAAGFDKDAEVYHAISDLGFGFAELGTVTPQPQEGNPRPRLFRLSRDKALVNRMGLNGDGADKVGKRLEKKGLTSTPVGINIGKMNDSDHIEAIDDYIEVFNKLNEYPDYFVLNVSCPNTPEEFDQSDPEYLEDVISKIQEENTDDEPVLLKLSPDSSDERLLEIAQLAEETGVEGLIATNTTNSREGVESSKKEEWGGLSGKPLEERSNEVIELLHRNTDLPIIGVGGVDTAESAYRKIRLGASLVQLYTGFIYKGPSIAREINKALVEKLEEDNFTSVDEAVGYEVE